MKIAMINGSPKKRKSASGELLRELKTCFTADVVCKEFTFNATKLNAETIEELNGFDAMVFAFPLLPVPNGGCRNY